MSQDTFLYTLPQWFVFAAFISSVYGWVEMKKVFQLIGPVIFFSLGIYAGYAIYSGYFSAHEFLTPEEMLQEEMEEESFDELPFVARLLPAYWLFVIGGVLAVPAFFLEWKGKKYKTLFILLTGLTALLGFFIITGALQNL